MNSKVEEEAAADENVCANCGIVGVDEIQLQECHDCDLVKYCSDKCREEHREQHTDECNKRAAKLRDKRLFTLPDGTHLGECPICFFPLSLDKRKSIFMSCCGKLICKGCVHANFMAHLHDIEKAGTCVFCREPPTERDNNEKLMKRVEANDPAALREIGVICHNDGDYDGAFDYLKKAAELGSFEAHYSLGLMYAMGEGVEKDEKKKVYHYEKAAIGGHTIARHNLGCHEEYSDNIERAIQHWIIAAKLGDEDTMKTLLPLFQQGYITKEEYGATLRTHQAAIEATKSPQREAAYAFYAKIEQKRKNTSD